MSKLIPNIQNGERFTALLVLGEILTKRNETGPLSRVWRPVGRRRPPQQTEKREPAEKKPE